MPRATVSTIVIAFVAAATATVLVMLVLVLSNNNNDHPRAWSDSLPVAKDAADADGPFYYKYKPSALRIEQCSLYGGATTSCASVPSYQESNDAGALWPCPALDDYSTTWPEYQHGGAVPQTPAGYALCPGAFQAGQCCLPQPGCLPPVAFNWIISTCVGTSCGDWGQADKYNTRSQNPMCSDVVSKTQGCIAGCNHSVPCMQACVTNAGFKPGQACKQDVDANTLCTVSDIGNVFGCSDQALVAKTIAARNQGSKVVVNYVATYTYDVDSQQWKKQPYSSFNTYGRYPAQDLSSAIDSSTHTSPSACFMPGPQPGGAVFWKYGWYPAGLAPQQAAGPPAMMFILSTQQCWNMAWFIMNQATLDRGPAIGYPAKTGSSMTFGCASKSAADTANTWACANSGEWDLLEVSWSEPGYQEDGSYDNLYATMSNEGNAGRALWPSTGQSGTGVGGFSSPCYIKGSRSQPQIFVSVIDQVGTYVYLLPPDQASRIWPGIQSTQCADTLQSAPSVKPKSAPCTDLGQFCAVFAPHSQGTTTQGVLATGFAPQDKGFCGNFTQAHFVDTHQQWGQTPAVMGGQKQAWNVEMECGHNP